MFSISFEPIAKLHFAGIQKLLFNCALRSFINKKLQPFQ